MRNQFYYNPRLIKTDRGYCASIYMRRNGQNIWMGCIDDSRYGFVLTMCKAKCNFLNHHFGNRLFAGGHFLKEVRKFIMI